MENMSTDGLPHCIGCDNLLSFMGSFKEEATGELFCSKQCYLIEKQHKKLEALSTELEALSTELEELFTELDKLIDQEELK